MDKLKKVYHRLLWEWYLQDIIQLDNNPERVTKPDYAIVYFAKKIPIEQLFASQEDAIKDWKLDIDNWIEKYKNKE